jgi:hypothetical protein
MSELITELTTAAEVLKKSSFNPISLSGTYGTFCLCSCHMSDHFCSWNRPAPPLLVTLSAISISALLRTKA